MDRQHPQRRALIVELEHRDPMTANAIGQLQRASYAVEAELIGTDRILPLHESDDDIAALDLVLLGWREGADLLAVVGYQRRGGLVDVDRLAVHPSAFRRGIGRTLLSEVHRREATAASFEISTGAANAPARRLYEQLGYTLQHERSVDGVAVVHLGRQG